MVIVGLIIALVNNNILLIAKKITIDLLGYFL